MKPGLTIVLLTLISIIVRGQNDENCCFDLLKLKNGLYVKCNIIEVKDTGISVVKNGRDTLFFSHDDYEVIKQNKATKKINTNNEMYFDFHRKYFGHISMGAGIGKFENSSINSRVFESKCKIRLSPKQGGHYLRFNLSRMGIEAVQSFSMWSGGSGYEFVFNRKKISPFTFGNVGYGFALNLAIENESEVVNYTSTTKGGINYELGAGLLFRSSRGYAFTLSSSFFHQPATIVIDYNPVYQVKNVYEMTLRRSLVKLGFLF